MERVIPLAGENATGEGGVVDGEALVEQLLELAADAVAVVAGVDEQVCRERAEAARDLPDGACVPAAPTATDKPGASRGSLPMRRIDERTRP